MRPSLTAALICALSTSVYAEPAAAQDDGCENQEAASAVYRDGASALDEGRFGDAARKFSEADDLCPHEVALGEALRAVEQANHPILCMELVERAERRSLHADSAKALRATCSPQVGRVVVKCPGATCSASMDGQPVPLHQPYWALLGEHVVDLSVDGGATTPYRIVVARADEVVVPPPQAPAAVPQPPPTPGPSPAPIPPPQGGDDGTVPAPEDGGLSPWWFALGAGLTAVSGGLTIWSGVDTLSINDDFRQTGDDALRQDGLDAETRTNAFVGVTVGLALLTTLAAIFTDWGGSDGDATATMEWSPKTTGDGALGVLRF